MSAVADNGRGRVGILAMAYGTPAGPDQIEAYYTHIRHGRPPTGELLTELRGRYEAIGGRSPLLEITRAQVAGLGRALAAAGAEETVLALGFKHAAPFIEDGVHELLAARVRRIVAVVLAPHYSRMSVGEYAQRVQAAVDGEADPPSVVVVRSWHLAQPYLELLARSVLDVLATLPAERRDRAQVLFTAHSLPTRILAEHDPYPDQLRETAAAVAELAQLGPERWGVAWQSAGRTPEPWIGPDVLEVLSDLRDRTDTVVVCPAGFVADHLEILYDLDIEARQRAAELGLCFARTASPNDSAALAQALAEVVLGQL